VEQFGNVLRMELAPAGVGVGVAHPAWVDTDMVRDQQRDLETFEEMRRRLPGPFGSLTTVQACAEAFVDAIERRRRKVFVPASLAPYSAVRQLFSSPVAERVVARLSRRLLPKLEREVRALGRSFGASSVGMGDASSVRD
jgi:short-subunit dehydrogenase